jgi:hypothetical protein
MVTVREPLDAWLWSRIHSGHLLHTEEILPLDIMVMRQREGPLYQSLGFAR